MRFHVRHSMPVALAAAMALTSLNLAPAQAAAPKASGQPQATQSAATTADFSARRRHYRRGNAAALGAVLGVFGTIAAIAAADRYRDDYYYGDPYYYGPGPYYYGGGSYYDGGYYSGGAYKGWGGGYRHHGGGGGGGGHHHHHK